MGHLKRDTLPPVCTKTRVNYVYSSIELIANISAVISFRIAQLSKMCFYRIFSLLHRNRILKPITPHQAQKKRVLKQDIAVATSDAHGLVISLNDVFMKKSSFSTYHIRTPKYLKENNLQQYQFLLYLLSLSLIFLIQARSVQENCF